MEYILFHIIPEEDLMEAPGTPVVPPEQMVPQKKKTKVWLIILIVVLVLCCCLAVVGGVLYFTGDQIMQGLQGLM